VTLEDSRRRREETTIQLRKTRKEEQMNKRRMGSMKQVMPNENKTNHNEIPTNQNQHTNEETSTVDKLMSVYYTWEKNPTAVSNDQLLETTQTFRRMSTSAQPSYKKMIDAGLISFLIRFLKMDDNDRLIFESTWILTNISSTSLTHFVVEQGVMAPLVDLLFNENPEIREQAAWCIGNIAGDKIEYRDQLLKYEKAAKGM